MRDAGDTTKAVILARGLGTRMRRASDGAALTPEQDGAADTGVKAMIPIGRPFLDYVLSALADAGYEEACLVIGPEHAAIREYYSERVKPTRIEVSFAIQPEPRGTADAVLAGESFAGGERFLVLNSDNYYPAEALEAMRGLHEAGLAGFDREALSRDSNISPERIAGFAVIESEDGRLRRIIEKPDAATLRGLDADVLVSMNCWSFTADIFAACRAVPLSPRGELELPMAVRYAIAELGRSFRVVPVHAPVLDLSSREDIPLVAARLAGVTVNL